MSHPLPSKPYYRVDELAAYWDVSPRYIRLLLQRRKLKYVRIGSVIRIPREAIESFQVSYDTTSVM